jgi:hypothetical protein
MAPIRIGVFLLLPEGGKRRQIQFEKKIYVYDLLCGVVVGVPGYRLRGPGSISEATRFSEK